ncbi:MAG: SDR family oxidoreductase [Dongiaceae bacterium]
MQRVERLQFSGQTISDAASIASQSLWRSHTNERRARCYQRRRTRLSSRSLRESARGKLNAEGAPSAIRHPVHRRHSEILRPIPVAAPVISTPLLSAGTCCTVSIRSLAKTLPPPRAASDEVATLALYLCSDEAVMVTGASYLIDGGLLAGI